MPRLSEAPVHWCFVTGWLNGLSSGCDYRSPDVRAKNLTDAPLCAMSIYLMAAFSIVMTIGFSLCEQTNPASDEFAGRGIWWCNCIYGVFMQVLLSQVHIMHLRLSACAGWLKSPLYFLIISAVINVILDVVFIVVFGMGEGCGYATVIDRNFGSVLPDLY